jgi:hypothetical protein
LTFGRFAVVRALAAAAFARARFTDFFLIATVFSARFALSATTAERVLRSHWR